jgi:beta-lactamase regulating signal transducer with metallopeptidase domain
MLGWLAETTIVAVALAGVVALICRSLSRQPALRHALWLVVLLKLLTPPWLAWPWPAPSNVYREPASFEALRAPFTEASAKPIPDRPLVPAAPFDPNLDADSIESAVPSEPFPLPEPSPEESVPSTKAQVASGLAATWAMGAAAMGLLQLVRIVRFQLQVARGMAAPRTLSTAVAELAALVKVAAPPVRLLPGLASPLAWGLGTPRLLWPAALLGRLPPDSERAAIVHELAHLRRRDHWIGWLQLIAGCVWWWSPLWWIVQRQLRGAAEEACDAWVVETLPQNRRAFALALVEVCSLQSDRAVPRLALGVDGRTQEIERRMRMILCESIPSRVSWRGLFSVALLALIALPGFTGGQDKPLSAPEGEQEPVRTAAQPATKTADDDREQRLRILEANLELLMKEVKELRGSSGASEKPNVSSAANPFASQALQPEKTYAVEIRNKPWKAVIEWFSDISGLSFASESLAIPGTFTFVGQKGKLYTLTEIIDILNEGLQQQKHVLLRRPRSFSIISSLERIDPTLVPRITPAGLGSRGRTELVSMEIPIATVKAKDVASK